MDGKSCNFSFSNFVCSVLESIHLCKTPGVLAGTRDHINMVSDADLFMSLIQAIRFGV